MKQASKEEQLQRLAYDVAFEIVLGGDRFDKLDLKSMLLASFGDVIYTMQWHDEFRDMVISNVKQIAPPWHDISDSYYSKAISYWTTF